MRLFLFAILLSGLPLLMWSQSSTNYTGDFSFDQYSGIADFQFLLDEGDTILNGPFSFEQMDLKRLINESDAFLSFSGSFQDGIPNGDWKFKLGDFQLADSTAFSQNFYLSAIDGVLNESRGFIKTGKLDGQWILKTHRLESSKKRDLLFESEFLFNEGVPMQDFRIANSNSSLLGRFLRDGLAHDVWSLYSNNTIGVAESWYFNAGLLEKIIIKRSDSLDTLRLYSEVNEEEKIIGFDQQYFDILQLHHELYATEDSSSQTVAFPKGAIALFNQNIEHYQQVVGLILALNNTNIMPEFKVKVPYMPLSEEEIILMDSIKVLLRRSVVLSEELSKNPQLNILKLAEPEVSFLIQSIKDISKYWLDGINNIVKYSEQGLLAYVSREDLVNKIRESKSMSTSFSVNYLATDTTESKVFEGPDSGMVIPKAQGLSFLKIFSEYTLKSLQFIDQQLRQKVTDREREEELDELENGLYLQIEHLNQSIDSLKELSDITQSQTLQGIKSTIAGLSRAYSLSENDVSKPERARQLSDCFNKTDILIQLVSEIPESTERIEQVYTEEVWNPFTSTIMKEDLKRNILKSYKTKLMPYLSKSIGSGLTCENIEYWTYLLKNTEPRMLALVEESTKKIEKKLKKEDNPEEILSLLSIAPSKDASEE
ncbi:MAG: hypothetical protein AAF363_01440 [Bacteroidota bacterium]